MRKLVLGLLLNSLSVTSFADAEYQTKNAVGLWRRIGTPTAVLVDSALTVRHCAAAINPAHMYVCESRASEPLRYDDRIDALVESFLFKSGVHVDPEHVDSARIRGPYFGSTYVRVTDANIVYLPSIHDVLLSW